MPISVVLFFPFFRKLTLSAAYYRRVGSTTAWIKARNLFGEILTTLKENIKRWRMPCRMSMNRARALADWDLKWFKMKPPDFYELLSITWKALSTHNTWRMSHLGITCEREKRNRNFIVAIIKKFFAVLRFVSALSSSLKQPPCQVVSSDNRHISCARRWQYSHTHAGRRWRWTGRMSF